MSKLPLSLCSLSLAFTLSSCATLFNTAKERIDIITMKSVLLLIGIQLFVSCGNAPSETSTISILSVEDTINIVTAATKDSVLKLPSQEELTKIVGAIIEKEQPDLLEYFDERSKHSIYSGRFINSSSDREQYLVYSESEAYHTKALKLMNLKTLIRMVS